jgi:hypothetical protein
MLGKKFILNGRRKKPWPKLRKHDGKVKMLVLKIPRTEMGNLRVLFAVLAEGMMDNLRVLVAEKVLHLAKRMVSLFRFLGAC